MANNVKFSFVFGGSNHGKTTVLKDLINDLIVTYPDIKILDSTFEKRSTPCLQKNVTTSQVLDNIAILSRTGLDTVVINTGSDGAYHWKNLCNVIDSIKGDVLVITALNWNKRPLFYADREMNKYYLTNSALAQVNWLSLSRTGTYSWFDYIRMRYIYKSTIRPYPSSSTFITAIRNRYSL